MAGNSASACNVPVFRYALERFPADAYHFVVFYRGSLSGQAKAAVDALQRLSRDSDPGPNLDLKTVDLDTLPHPVAKDAEKPNGTAEPAWAPPKNAKLPWLAVMFPGDDSLPLWSAPLEVQDLPGLVDSPARRQIVKRLLGGESAVFLMLESGRKEEDAKTAKLLTTSIERMQKDLRLPSDDGTDKLQSDLSLRIAFSVVAIRRDDPAESLLVKIVESKLEHSGLKKTQEDGGPIVCPIFGRGRILGAAAGEVLTAEAIEAACQFLCGACACTIKGELTGADLLLTADWDSLLENRVVHDDPPALQSLGAMATAARAAATPPAAVGLISPTVSTPQGSQAGTAALGGGTGGVLDVVVGSLGAVIIAIAIAGGLMWIATRRKGRA